MTIKTGNPRGFAAMSPELQREIASKGGKTSHLKGTAHEFTSAEAKAAGAKGGAVVARDRKHMSEIGRRGGLASHNSRGQKAREQAMVEVAERTPAE